MQFMEEVGENPADHADKPSPLQEQSHDIEVPGLQRRHHGEGERPGNQAQREPRSRRDNQDAQNRRVRHLLYGAHHPVNY